MATTLIGFSVAFVDCNLRGFVLGDVVEINTLQKWIERGIYKSLNNSF